MNLEIFIDYCDPDFFFLSFSLFKKNFFFFLKTPACQYQDCPVCFEL